jgi:DNA polymerase-1
MVAKTIHLPNVRKLFKPDPGFILCDCDLDQADARVVAWDANAPKLKEIFNDPTKDLHDENALALYGRVDKRTRPLAKRGVHATNYVITARSLGRALGISTTEAERFISVWFSTHPEIPVWHDTIQQDLAYTRTVKNAFGFRKVFFDRVESLLPQAVAWIPQSTVAIVINKGLLNLHRRLPQVQILSQVHDSLVFQIPQRQYPDVLPIIKECLTIPVPYENDPLIIPVSAQVSKRSWGECFAIDWEGNFEPSETMSELAIKQAAGF